MNLIETEKLLAVCLVKCQFIFTSLLTQSEIIMCKDVLTKTLLLEAKINITD